MACKDEDVRHVRAIIIGPPETPYEFGFFEFQIKFGREYPTKPPAVTAVTTNGGRTRFNPNIYAQGKVCLSILGTWRGERGEEWSSAQGLESVLISIQSLMSANPYENEPGFEDANSEKDKVAQAEYVAKIRHETLRISVIERLEDYMNINRHRSKIMVYNGISDMRASAFDPPFEPFVDKCKRLFLWHFDLYLNSIETEAVKHKDHTRFEKMPFEGANNSMEGYFEYSDLKKRLLTIRDRLDEELLDWAREGQKAVESDRSIAVNLQRQFEQTKEHINNGMSLDIDLVDKNPFVWQIILYGRPMTNLDGGVFRIKIHLSPRFPDELPRVKVETPLFHHRVSKAGHLYYPLPDNIEDMKRHVEQIVSAIEDEAPAFDPRTLVNLEANKLMWGSPEDKKVYNRKLRKSAQDSAEYVDDLIQLMQSANIAIR